MTFIVAEFGNQHGGDFIHAQELIQAAKESGADCAKSQAFFAKDIQGSMPYQFYKKLELGYEKYLELISYGNSIGIDVFFSVFSPELIELEQYQKYLKLAGSQTRKGNYNLENYDDPDTFVSVPFDVMPPKFKYAKMLYVSDYLPKDPRLSHINLLKRFYNRPVGYSDHTIGINTCVEAVRLYECPVIEKHFTIKKDLGFGETTYRDNIHSVTPKEFSEMVKQIRQVKLN